MSIRPEVMPVLPEEYRWRISSKNIAGDILYLQRKKTTLGIIHWTIVHSEFVVTVSGSSSYRENVVYTAKMIARRHNELRYPDRDTVVSAINHGKEI